MYFTEVDVLDGAPLLDINKSPISNILIAEKMLFLAG